MAFKKWGYFLISLWLINTLVCFHPTIDPLNGVSANCLVLQDNTLVDVLINHLSGQEDKHHHHKIIQRNRFINSRSHSLNVQLPIAQFSQQIPVAKNIIAAKFSFGESKLFLPPLYHYLFRLSPF